LFGIAAFVLAFEFIEDGLLQFFVGGIPTGKNTFFSGQFSVHGMLPGGGLRVAVDEARIIPVSHKNLTKEMGRKKMVRGCCPNAWRRTESSLWEGSRRSFSIFHAFLKKAVYPELFPAS
jgi:hypothetical protein